MPLFTAIGTALGVGAAAAFGAGIGATVLATAVGIGGYALGGGFGDGSSSADARVEAATGIGKLSEAESQTIAKKKAYRSGIITTSPSGLDTEAQTSTAKLK